MQRIIVRQNELVDEVNFFHSVVYFNVRYSQLSLSDISLKPSEESSSGETEKDENSEGSGSEGTVSGAEGEASESTDETMTLYNNAQESTETAGYQAYSDALFDELMSTIDSISGSETATETETPIVPDISGYETVTVKYVDTPDYAAGVFADDDEILEVLSAVPTADVNTKSNTSS